jgi:hypothetical protein
VPAAAAAAGAGRGRAAKREGDNAGVAARDSIALPTAECVQSIYLISRSESANAGPRAYVRRRCNPVQKFKIERPSGSWILQSAADWVRRGQQEEKVIYFRGARRGPRRKKIYAMCHKNYVILSDFLPYVMLHVTGMVFMPRVMCRNLK